MRNRNLTGLLLVSGMLAAAACGDDDESASAGESTGGELAGATSG